MPRRCKEKNNYATKLECYLLLHPMAQKMLNSSTKWKLNTALINLGGMNGMTGSEFDEHNDLERSKQIKGRRRKRYDEEDDTDYRQKRSSKRFHRRKTLRDQLWEDDEPKKSPDRG